ncbi:MAG: hypothetical protein CVU87_10720 [Firmicutes bacterium HGW-Firmicutes-12]|nr:MAG: hypothetical protein CVU87_10720 [Firmicutes bacterium HGW-Firmicutes-12]
MKKILLLILALVMVLSLAACGGESPSEAVALVDVTTELGISLKLPSDMTKQSEVIYVNMETGDVASFGVEVGGTPLSDWNEETVLTTYQSKYKDVVIKSFENGKKINGKEALVSKLTLTTPKGSPLTMALVMLTDGNKIYVVSLAYGTDKTEGSLATNLQACIDSITISTIAATVEDDAEEGYATDEQKEEMIDMLVEMFNGVNTDFQGMIDLMNEKGLVVEGTELTEDLLEYTAALEYVRDGLSGETMTSADAEEFLDIIEATDVFIGETIEAYLVD